MTADTKPKRQWRITKEGYLTTIADLRKRNEAQRVTILSLMDQLSEWRFRAFLAAVSVVCVGLIGIGAWLL